MTAATVLMQLVCVLTICGAALLAFECLREPHGMGDDEGVYRSPKSGPEIAHNLLRKETW